MRHTVLIYTDGDMEQLVDLRTRVGIAERNAHRADLVPAAPRRRGDTGETAADQTLALIDAQAAYAAFADEAAERAEAWIVETIGHVEFRELLREHLPRKITETDADGNAVEVVHPEDRGFMVNTDTFPQALLHFVDPDDETHRTVVGPVFDSEVAFRKRLRRLSAGQFDTLWISALNLNRGLVADPKAERFSSAIRTSSAT